MRKLTSTLVAAVALVALPHVALAQRTRVAAASGPKNEIGVDLGAAYSHMGSGCTANCDSFGVGTPVDIRWGFLANGPLSFEPRFTFNWLPRGGGHVRSLHPHLNVSYRISHAPPRRGMSPVRGLR